MFHSGSDTRWSSPSRFPLLVTWRYLYIVRSFRILISVASSSSYGQLIILSGCLMTVRAYVFVVLIPTLFTTQLAAQYISCLLEVLDCGWPLCISVMFPVDLWDIQVLVSFMSASLPSGNSITFTLFAIIHCKGADWWSLHSWINVRISSLQ